MLTRCPGCATVFRAGHELLAARQGLVRCGRCGEVFNARWHPVDAPAATGAAASPSPPAAPPQDEEAARQLAAVVVDDGGQRSAGDAPGAARRPRTIGASTAPARPMPPQSPAPPPAPTAPPASTAPKVPSAPAAPIPPRQPNGANPAAPGATPAPVPGRPRPPSAAPALTGPGSSADAGKRTPRPAAGADASDVQLVRVRVPHRRQVLAIRALLVVLVLTLGWQSVYFHGPRALEMEGVRTAATQVCERLGCEVPPRHAVEAWTVAGARVAAFADEPDALRVEVSLINRASFPQSGPHLEVTLSDRHGRAVARRVFDPGAYLGEPRAVIEPGVLAEGVLVLAVPPPAAIGFEVRVVDGTRAVAAQ